MVPTPKEDDMTLSLQITLRQAPGGAIRIYPACDRASRMASLLGSKVFTLEQVAQLKAIGFQIDTGAILNSARPQKQAPAIAHQTKPNIVPMPVVQERRGIRLFGR